MTGLKRFLEPPAAAPIPERADAGAQAEERCELCATPVASEHGHLVDTESRRLLCACRACYLLFTQEGAGGGHYRAIPDRYLYDPDFELSESAWNALQIPVRMAFFFHHSHLERTVAFYPSPAGATESELPLAAWGAVAATTPLTDLAQPDVEALLVRQGETGFECYLAPIDACYELVGHMRLTWKGFDGGSEAWQTIDGFFADLQARSKPVSAPTRDARRSGRREAREPPDLSTDMSRT